MKQTTLNVKKDVLFSLEIKEVDDIKLHFKLLL